MTSASAAGTTERHRRNAAGRPSEHGVAGGLGHDRAPGGQVLRRDVRLENLRF